MTRQLDDMDRLLAGWLREEAVEQEPSGFHARAVELVRRSRQRPGWVVMVRGGSLGAAGHGGRVTRPVVMVALVAALLLALAAGALVVGGQPAPSIPRPLIPAGQGAFTPTGSTMHPHRNHVAVRLRDGRVLVVGGEEDHQPAELYDPDTGTFSPAGSLAWDPNEVRSATLLPDDRVLVTGHEGSGAAAAVLWDPATQVFTPTGPPTFTTGDVIGGSVAISLPDGRVFVTSETELLDPPQVWDGASGTFRPGWSSGEGFPVANAVLLRDGRVLVTSMNQARTWDPVTGALGPGVAFPGAGSMTVLSSGELLLLLGHDAQTWDPVTGVATPAGGLLGDGAVHPVLLQDGRVLLAGGTRADKQGALTRLTPVATAEVWDLVTRTSSQTGSMSTARDHRTATLLLDGRVLMVGGEDSSDSRTAELFDPDPASRPAPTPTPMPTLAPMPSPLTSSDAFSMTGSLEFGREGHAAVLLANGRVLVVGGQDDIPGAPPIPAEIWDPRTGMFTPTGVPLTQHAHTFTLLLADGRALVLGTDADPDPGADLPVAEADAQIWDPETGAFNAAGVLPRMTGLERLVLQDDGRAVFVIHGAGIPDDRWDPAAGTWTQGQDSSYIRADAVQAPDGRYLRIGHDVALLQDADAASSEPAGTLVQGRDVPALTVLPDGSVLVTGGEAFDPPLGSPGPLHQLVVVPWAETWDPDSHTFMSAGNMHEGRFRHTATVLDDGRVLIVGGYGMGTGGIRSAEIFTPD
jgi:WD40 repeat protein